jgi:hypothetical protein
MEELAVLLGRMFGANASSMLASSGAMPPLPMPRPPEAGPGKDTSQVMNPPPPPAQPAFDQTFNSFTNSMPGVPGDYMVPTAQALAGPEAPAPVASIPGTSSPMPGALPSDLPGGGQDLSGSPETNKNLQPIGTPPQSGVEKMLAALRGVTVPKPPEPQRVSTPANPGRAPATAPQQNIMQLLQMMMAGHPQSAQMSLGQALSGRG